MRVRHLFVSLGILAATAVAHADPITYTIQGYLVTDPRQAITLTGMTTIEVNNTNPSVLNIVLNFSNGTTQSGIGTLGQDHSHNVYVGVANDLLSFTDDLHNFTPAGGKFNLRDVSGDYVGSVFGGTLTMASPAAAQTPEPSSITLLCTGLLGFAGLVKRRLS